MNRFVSIAIATLLLVGVIANAWRVVKAEEIWGGGGHEIVDANQYLGDEKIDGPLMFRWDEPPTWYGGVDVIALKRDAREDIDFAALGTADNIVLGTQDLKFEFEHGFNVYAGRRIGDLYAVEASYFRVDDWTATASVRDDSPSAPGGVGNLLSPFSDFGAAPINEFDFNSLVTISHRSSLESIELKLLRRMPPTKTPLKTAIYGGARYYQISEQFQYFTESDVPAPGTTTNDITVSTDNHLIGGQIGLLVQFPDKHRWRVDLEVEGSLLRNLAEQQTIFTQTDGVGAMQTFATSAAEERTAISFEVDLSFYYRVTPWLSVRGGYQYVWIDGVALAADNFQTDANLIQLGPGQLVHDGNVDYHGPYAGLEISR